MAVPEDIEQLLIRDLLWIKLNLNGFCMSGSIRTYILVSWVGERAALITNCRRDHTLRLAKRLLDAPKTSCCKRCFLCRHIYILFDNAIDFHNSYIRNSR